MARKRCSFPTTLRSLALLATHFSVSLHMHNIPSTLHPPFDSGCVLRSSLRRAAAAGTRLLRVSVDVEKGVASVVFQTSEDTGYVAYMVTTCDGDDARVMRGEDSCGTVF